MRPCIESRIEIVVTADCIGSEENDVRVRTCGAQLTFYVSWRRSRRTRGLRYRHWLSPEMSSTHDQQSTMSFGQDLILDHLRIPLLAIGDIRAKVFGVVNFVPVSVGISKNDAHLMFAATLQI